MTRITVRLRPRAGRDAIDGWDGIVLHARVAAAPTDGQANEALVQIVAKTLGVAPSRVRLVSGARARTKLLDIDGVTLAEIEARLKGRIGR